MRYIANSSGYLQQVSFGADITCGGTNCTEYTGAVPPGYKSLDEWYCQEGEKLYRWKITGGQLAQDSGAAPPSEFGFGSAQRIDVDIDKITAPGWYYWSGAATIAGITANYWYMHVSAWGTGSQHCVQKIYPCIGTYGFTEIIRKKHSNEWLPPEHTNPPMLAGVEYRTTERWHGKAVYAIAVDFGALPSMSSKSVYVNTAGVKTIVDIGGHITNGSEYNPITMGYSGALGAYAYCNANPSNIGVSVRTTSDLSAYSGYFTVKYTKD